MYQARISIKEEELSEILGMEQFKLYCQVFAQFCLGTVTCDVGLKEPSVSPRR